MQNLNNLFLTAPYAVYAYVKIFRRRAGVYGFVSFPWKAMVGMLAVMITVQSMGFHSQFVFRDGMDGTKRDYTFVESKTLAGMHTTDGNGVALTNLTNYMEGKGLQTEAYSREFCRL